MLVLLDHVAGRIVNANEVASRTKVATMKHGADGKISGLVVDSVIE